MNRATGYILSLAILFVLGCDTKDNIKPRNENFFVKMYDGVLPGDQFGVDVIETSDGGLLIAGTEMSDDGSEAMLLIKTNSKGEEEWIRGSSSDYNWTTNGRSKSLIELPDGSGYILGGTLGNGNQRRSVLLKVDASGGLIDSTMLKTKTASQEFYNQLSKITITHELIIVSGETGLIENGVGDGINGFFGVLTFDLATPQDFDLDDSSFPVKFFGQNGDEIIVGAYEFQDTSAIVSDPRFVIFGSSVNSDNSNLTDYFSLVVRKDLGDFEYLKSKNDGNQIPNYVNRLGDQDHFFIIGETDDLGLQIYLNQWENFGWTKTNRAIVGNSDNVKGTGVAIKNNEEYFVVGDNIFNQGVSQEIFLSKLDIGQAVASPWPKLFGTTTSAYRSSAVTLLQDGSIVIVGTADLDPIKKILVIKTGPNGEMSF